jgi:catechol 2,3-dioxygenase-like lactoylglutathione lyase family enzyme
MAGIDGFAHVTLSVRDHDRSAGWYGEVPGFQPALSETTAR